MTASIVSALDAVQVMASDLPPTPLCFRAGDGRWAQAAVLALRDDGALLVLPEGAVLPESLATGNLASSLEELGPNTTTLTPLANRGAAQLGTNPR